MERGCQTATIGRYSPFTNPECALEDVLRRAAKDTLDALVLFRGDMGAYVRIYGFLSQIFDYGNTAIEKRFLFHMGRKAKRPLARPHWKALHPRLRGDDGQCLTSSRLPAPCLPRP